MSRKPSRRKKPAPVKRKRMTFRLTVEAQEMVVSYEPHWMRDVGHFVFRSPHKPPRRIPVSETGYLSRYAAMAEVEAAASPQDFARDEVLAIMRSRRRTRIDETNQLPLFQ
jgi:hypothetical protein